MASPSTPGFKERVFFTTLKQTAFGTPIPTPTTNLPFSTGLRASSPVQDTPDHRPRLDVAGNEYPQQVDKYKNSIDWNAELEANFLVLLWTVAFCLGENADSGAGLIHTITQIASRVLPVTTIISAGVGDGEAKVQYQDMACLSFSIKGTAGVENTIQLSGVWKGSGVKTTPTYTEPDITRLARMRMGGLSFKVGAADPDPTAGTDIADQIKDFTLGYTNNAFDGYRPGGSMNATIAEAGNRRAASLSFNVKQGVTGWEALRDAGTRQSIAIKVTDDTGNNNVLFFFPECEVLKVDRAGGDELTANVTIQPLMDPDGDGYDALYPNDMYIIGTTAAVITPALLSEPV